MSNLLHVFNVIFLMEKDVCFLACGFQSWRLADSGMTWIIPLVSSFEVTNVMTRGSLGAFMDNDSFQLIWDISCCGSFVWRVMVFRKTKLSPCNLSSCQAFYHHFEILQSECTMTEGIGMWATSSMHQYFLSNWWDKNGTEIIQHLPEDKHYYHVVCT